MEVKETSECLGPILVEYTFVPEGGFGQTKLHQVTRDDVLAYP